VLQVASRVAGVAEPGRSLITGGARTLLDAAVISISAGQDEGLDLLARALADVSATFAFAGSGEPHDLVAGARLLDAVRTLLVDDLPPLSGQESATSADSRPGVRCGLRLLSVFPPSWYGLPLELHDAPTSHGRLSYALRWHGTRPALLWELDSPGDAGPVRITVPGLDPAWSTTASRGEALLAEVNHPGPDGSFT
jgi:hypothetical protein